MNSYELTFLVGDKNEADNLKKILTSLEGTIQEEKHWGTQVLAYPINKLDSADYYTWQIKIAQKNVSEFKNKLNFSEAIIRYILLKRGEN